MILPPEWTRLTVRLLCGILFFTQMHHCSILPPRDISQLHRGSSCTHISDRYDPRHNYTVHVGPGLDTSIKRCCMFRRCPPGTHGIICGEHDPKSTECRKCDDNHYSTQSTSSDDAERDCVGNKRGCYGQGEYLKKTGSAMEDNVCGCDATAGYYIIDQIHDRINCQSKTCAAGTQMSEEKHGCVPCTNGTFKPAKDHSRCEKWTITKCEKDEELILGNTTTDSSCVRETASTVTLPPVPHFVSIRIPDVAVEVERPSESIPLWVVVLLIVLSAATGIPVIITAVYLVRKRRPCKNTLPDRDPSGDNNDVSSSEERLMDVTSGPVDDVDPEVTSRSRGGQSLCPSPSSSGCSLPGPPGIGYEAPEQSKPLAPITVHPIVHIVNNYNIKDAKSVNIGHDNQTTVDGDQQKGSLTSPKEIGAPFSNDS